jgi:hypothetical protein
MEKIKNKQVLYWLIIYTPMFLVNGEKPLETDEFLKTIKRSGVYSENNNISDKGILIWNEETKQQTLFQFSTIYKIIWECPMIPLESIQNKFDFKEGRVLNWHEAQEILRFLELQTKEKYELRIKFNKKGQAQLTVGQVPSKKFFIKKVYISGNEILSSKLIKESISSVLCEINFLEKCKYLFFNRTSCMFFGECQTQMVENAILELAKKYLLLGTTVAITYELDPHSQEVVVYIHVEEGRKFFIDNIYMKGFKFNKVLLRDYINEHGFQQDSFNYLSDFLLKDMEIDHIYTSYTIDNETRCIDIFLSKEQRGTSLVVEAIIFQITDISMRYLVNSCTIGVGDVFDEWKIKKFCNKLTLLFEKKIYYEIAPCKDTSQNKVIVTFKEEATEKNRELLVVDKGAVLQYPMHKFLPWLKITCIPKFPFTSKPLLSKIGGQIALEHKISSTKSLEIINISGYINPRNYNNLTNLLQSFQVGILQFNHKQKYTHVTITLLTIHKYFHEFMKSHLKDHKYFYTYLLGRHTVFFENKCLLALYGYGQIFYTPLTAKINLQPEFLIPISSKSSFIISLRFLGNSQNIHDFYKHLSAINNKRDEAFGLLWNHYDNYAKHAITNHEDLAFIYTKGIVLSNHLYNLRFLWNYRIFKFDIPSLGLIKIFICIFLNLNYDYTNRIWRSSFGVGLMGIFNQVACIGAIGYRQNLSEAQENNDGLKCSLNVEHYGF